jgi:hypothetical protein
MGLEKNARLRVHVAGKKQRVVEDLFLFLFFV